MSLTPFIAAPLLIQIHAIFALLAVALTISLLVLPKGHRLHKIMGWTWVIFMAVVAISSFWINEMRIIGPLGPIHILSVITLVSLWRNVRAARHKNIQAHAKGMKSLVFGALLVAGAFTFLPGRLMFQIVMGG